MGRSGPTHKNCDYSFPFPSPNAHIWGYFEMVPTASWKIPKTPRKQPFVRGKNYTFKIVTLKLSLWYAYIFTEF